MNCQARMGLLVLRGCEEPAVGACAVCGKGLCAMHQVMGEQGMTCPECSGSPEEKDREEYYQEYGEPDETPLFGDRKYFSPEDAAAARAAQQGGRRGHDPHET